MLTLLLSVLAVALAGWVQWTRGRLRSLPPGPFPLPVIGNIPQLAVNTHKAVAKLADQYGEVMTLWFGAEPSVILSSPAVVNEALNKNGSIYSSRPHFPLVDAWLEGSQDLVFSEYNENFRRMRKLVHQVLNVRTVQSLKHFVDFETRDFLKLLLKKGGSAVNPRPLIKRASVNVIFQTCFGTRFDENLQNPDFLQMMELTEQIIWVSGPQPANFLKWLRHVPGANNIFKYTADLCVRRNNYFDSKIDAVRAQLHRERETGVASDTADKYDPLKMCFVKALLLQEAGDEPLTKEELRLLTQDLLLGGIDTASTSLEWALCFLVNDPKVLNKVRAELDAVVGRDRLPHAEDLEKLKYLQCVVQEVFRSRPVVPMAIPHCTTEEHVLRGYTIPKNTTVMMFTYGINQNPAFFPDPERFNPDRFEPAIKDPASFSAQGPGDTRPNNPANLFTFGAGRRICVGMHLGMMELQLGLARLLHCFDLRTESGGPACVEELLGLTLQPRVPTNLVFTPRVSIDVAALIDA